MKTKFIEKSYIVAIMMAIKEKYFHEKYVKISECNRLKEILIKELEKKKVDAIIMDDNIDEEYFIVQDNIIFLNKENNINIDDIKSRYQGFLPIEILNIIWNIDYLYKFIYSNDKNLLKQEFEPMNLDIIIEKVVNNPTLFYEKVARSLSKEEYQYLASKLFDKQICSNCTNLCCGKDHDKDNLYCSKWSNDEEIGKAKVLIKD